jgi:XTP/dITP diphosphohydrolase
MSQVGVLRMVVATGNRHKLVELRHLLAELPVEILGPDDLPDGVSFEGAEETGDTFEANADIKAIHAARATGLPAIADDSGLEVDALDGRPGVRSARYAGEDAADGDNNAKLIAEARAAGLDRPLARFRCVISLAAPDGRVLARGRGHCEGVLIEEARGTSGFGYDPHFYAPSLGATFAEITPDQKHAVSHRARAMADLQRALPAALEELRS